MNCNAYAPEDMLSLLKSLSPLHQYKASDLHPRTEAEGDRMPGG
jgi:hypothetical protein